PPHRVAPPPRRATRGSARPVPSAPSGRPPVRSTPAPLPRPATTRGRSGTAGPHPEGRPLGRRATPPGPRTGPPRGGPRRPSVRGTGPGPPRPVRRTIRSPPQIGRAHV